MFFHYPLQLKKPSSFFYFCDFYNIRYYSPAFTNMSVFTYAVCSEEIKSGGTFFSFPERGFDSISRSAFNKETGVQFFMNALSLCVFPIS